MRRLIVVVACAVLVTAAVMTWIARRDDARHVVVPDAEMILIRDRNAIIFLSPAIMQRAFGPRWRELSLFYGTNRAIVNDEPAMVSPQPMRPLAKGNPVVFVSGDRWRDLQVPVYALETRQSALFVIDTIAGRVTLRSPARADARPVHVGTDGLLSFR